MVFPLWNLLRNDLPLSGRSFHLINRLLRERLHWASRDLCQEVVSRRDRRTHVDPMVWNEPC